MRKHYLDNIRFLTIFFVVIFHVYFYYNNIGTEAMFAGLKPYEGAVTFAGIYQYFFTRGLCYCCLWSPESVQDMHWKRGQKDSF